MSLGCNYLVILGGLTKIILSTVRIPKAIENTLETITLPSMSQLINIQADLSS